MLSSESFQEVCEGVIQLWIKVAALAFGAVLFPLLFPRQYVPVDPKNPMSSPNPEQTASLLSLIFFSYLDSLIFKASKLPHLSTEALPPLSDDDHARVLRAKNIARLDPLSEGGNRHVFFNLLRVFPYEILSMSIALMFNATTTFIPAVATNRLLSNLETKKSESGLPPWFWIALLFIGPVLTSSSIEWYMRVVLRAFVRIEALLTELMFEHANRARVKSNAGEDGSNDAPSNTNTSTGNINTLITVDLNTVEQGQHFLVLITYIPVQIVICIVFLYQLLGWSAFVGIGLTSVLALVPSVVGESLHSVQEDKMKKTDSRVQMFTDVVNVLRMVKLFGWEEKMSEKIAGKRIIELKASRKARLLELLCSAICDDVDNVRMLEPDTDRLPSRHSMRITAKVSLDRINKFLQKTELLDAFDSGHNASVANEQFSDKIGFHNASFTWSNHTSGTTTPSGRRFVFTVPGSLHFKPNALNLIIGPTGSGKTSILLALLGEMHYTPLNSDAWFNLPRDGGIAYAAQESWDNIIFGSPYNEERYKKVIKQCALERDLTLFAAGDNTEIGEKGLTLSGGQKARVTLARAVYSQADILLLDDILAALDVHTSKWIVEHCLSGDLLQGRTVIMVSHNLSLLTPLAQCFITMKDGTATLSDNVDAYLELDPSKELLKRASEQVDFETGEKQDDSANGKLIVSEEVHRGTGVGWAAIKLYASSLGGDRSFWFYSMFFGFLMAGHLASICTTWYLGFWASQYNDHAPAEVPALYYLSIYGEILTFSGSPICLNFISGLIFSLYLLVISAAHITFIVASVKASEVIHNSLVQSVLGATFRWLDETPVSRIITRCTKDIGSVDLAVPMLGSRVSDFSIHLLLEIGTVVLFTPMFLLPSVILTALGAWVGTTYLKAQSSVKREMSNAKAPVVGLIGAASTGLVSVRAYSAQDKFADLLMTRIDHYSRSARVFYNLQRWMAMRTETLAGLFTASLAWYLIYFTDSSPSDIGFLLNLAIGFSSGIVWWLIAANDLEAESNSLERLESYLRIDQEAQGDGRIPPAHWPSSGELRVENFTAKYSPDGPEVLHSLSFHIKSGERIGVVGRTGSGKSTLTLALLRCIITGGDVFYDGILTSTLNLDALRSKITIIPQTPELISGTLRQNLDPFDEDHDDAALNDALRAAGLFALQEELDVEDRINLDTVIASGGTNLSVGQRQIIALARAIVRRSKLLILDEATSAIDYKTDTIIQDSLRNEYKERGGSATILTIAHRLQTVMDADRIMVLEAGRIIEFDSPKELLQKKDGQFRAMVEHANDKEALLTMVKK
ncbi:P-loop containing nucleoside triphosphate hydrolase protein [Gymnopus androsaceus JB14]|uniref:P-loop containing nucleoside triphosphate hydrolase protein n=1 Tax=Gymnopus androsaceus JB14 TaxID=1447944 RepID=A0A6A4HPN0_9AGAR|nr:P-loop containing nucleoside triphosphate hydrolase protein [Gymnopus androsaceus JB14]